MWICPYCNQPVPNPANRKCPNGHGLFDARIMGSTVEKTAGKSFIAALLTCLALAVAVTSINGLWPSGPLRGALGYVLVAFIAFGVVALLRGLKWKRQGGPVVRLAPRAFGTGAGCIAAGAGLFTLGFVYDLIH